MLAITWCVGEAANARLGSHLVRVLLGKLHVTLARRSSLLVPKVLVPPCLLQAGKTCNCVGPLHVGFGTVKTVGPGNLHWGYAARIIVR
jgi:hypothetical protein